jgi:ABC-type long-subunit fatty acid transport system fused permease/ATPase subunit
LQLRLLQPSPGIFYLQADNIFVLHHPGAAHRRGQLTLWVLQIMRAFGQVSSFFHYLINAWTTIVDSHLHLQAPARLRSDPPIDKPMDKIEKESPPDETPAP